MENKIMELVNKYKRIELTGKFESGIEGLVIKTNRKIKIEKTFTRYKFYCNGAWQVDLPEDALISIIQGFLTFKPTHVKSY